MPAETDPVIIRDPDVKILAAISQATNAQFTSEEDEWELSPFGWIKTKPSRQVGKIGELMVAGWLATRGFNVSRSPDSDADRVIEGKRVEVKFSTQWKAGGYKFQQLRDQNYDLVICLGVSPFDAHCWVIPKADVLRLWREDHVIRSQHGGSGGVDTAWLDVPTPSHPPAWLAPYGGKLSSAIDELSRITGYKVKPIWEELAEEQV